MRGAGVRIEALRFALLIVLTVALASVAFRINSHSSSSSTSSHAHSGPMTGPLTGPQGSSPSATSPGPQNSPAQQQPGTAGGSGSAGGGGGGAGSSGGGGGTVQQLPVTGWDSAMKLGALAFVLIGGGMFSIRSAGPSRRRQRASVQD